MTSFVVLTRPQGQNESLAARLRDSGMDTLLLPGLLIQPLLDDPGLLPVPDDYDLLIFVSGSAARLYLDLYGRRRAPTPWPSSCWVATVGQSSAGALYQAGCIPHAHIVHPDPAGGQDSKALWERLQRTEQRFERVLIVRGETGREWLGQQFEQAGASVRRYALYSRKPLHWTREQCHDLQTRLDARATPVCVLTSGESIDAVCLNIERNGLQEFWARARYVVIHERVARRLQSVFADAGGMTPDPVVKVCSPNDDAIFEMIASTASL
ncbi:uroporphyrinogen-III synthase [Paralcaligenes ureilyticus]|uniref:Uroporphyrinogen-III synthase n=1 Tax=Paralcaligenes ureilyticus TaxID=627131 RepID=A0A4R3LU85_9BURK|nr:uroporphyrinogen-III synthase [Paralcaligenes ureilyticus]TCT04083.1 uroporphyrinogen-III synthase [Paralcaligenes ureilyticus]